MNNIEITRSPDFAANAAALAGWMDACSLCGSQISGACWIIQRAPDGSVRPVAEARAADNWDLVCNGCAESIPAEFKMEDD